ncbi:hypothetical protein [Leptolyngbya sp. PCC 6406]|uniref:hypothetical protein n=1 Tax=Leptolyngbya sp. PCC 6406 TaxID=1173264 RepID=UPI0002AC0634|nr:hypothetical protein [Leptolyngbya sp. PCC 6406]
MLSPTLGTSPAPTRWLPWVLAVALFWLSGSLLLDLLVMPVMYTSGMMAGSNFATAGYSLFEAFNHVELLCAALILTGLLTLRRSTAQAFGAVVSGSRCRWAVGIATLLLTLALVYTYGLTPEMGALGLSLDAFATQVEPPAAMAWMHGAYWGLELVKLAGLGFLLSLCAQDLSTSTQ